MAETIRGIGVSPGAVVGPCYLVTEATSEAGEAGPPEEEERTLNEAVAKGATQLEEIAQKLRSEGHEAEAGIMEAQGLMLQDPSLLDAARQRIGAGQPAAAAVQEAAAQFKAMFEEIEDPYLRARAADVQDIADRICRNLAPGAAEPRLDRPCVLVARDLNPSQTAALDRSLVLGVATDLGSQTSHTAILARALNIPAVVALGDVSSRATAGGEIALDGDSGTVILDPAPSQREEFAARAGEDAARRERRRSLRDLPAQTVDDKRVILAANIGSPADVPAALEAGAEGVGLFRTEFLFAERSIMPTEEEQVEAYRAVLEAMGEHTVVIRTLDVGGDKPLPYLPQPAEGNPFLGLRGVRLTLAHPDLFRAQLRALMRASRFGKLAVMFPMVSELDQLERAGAMLEGARADVGGEAEVGIMIEVPAAAIIASRLAPHVSFFSVGTNDLVQYTLAVDRTNDRVAPLYHPLHPAILRLLEGTVESAHAHGRWAGICGEMAGDDLAIPLLVGLGFDELSMTPSRIPEAKERIISLGFADCRALIRRALQCATGDEVADLVQDEMPAEGRRE